MDESLMKMNIAFGHTISKGIPWKSFSEYELQIILKIHFEILGYNVIWRHKEDPANERGIDLECNRDYDNRRIVVAVKKKPRKDDLGQLLELSQTEADKRIYVYVNGAAQSFRDQIKNFSSKVEFWDNRIIEEKLNESDLTIRLKINNSLTTMAICDIMNILTEIIHSQFPEEHEFTPSKYLIKLLWDMKDRAVTVRKCSSMLQLMFEDSSRFEELDDAKIQALVVWCIDFIYTDGLKSLQSLFNGLPLELKYLLHCTYEKTKVRSNWLELFKYDPGLIPGNVESILSQHENNHALLKILSEKKQSLPSTEILNKFNSSKMDDIATEFRFFSIWADGLEGTIDSLFEEYLEYPY